MARKVDARVEYQGNIYLVQPFTPRANKWIRDHVSEDAMFWGGALVVDQHYIDNLISGMEGDGLTIQ